MKVILIDDEEPSLRLMKLMVEKNDYLETVGAYTGAKEALEQIPKLRPDAVFTDIEMPEMSGLELAKAIRRLDDGIQIIFVTAYEQYALDAFEVGAVNYLLKPITAEGLETTVNRLLKNYNAQESRARTGLQNRILTLGGLQVYGARSDEPVKWPTAKVQELFACFVCQWGREIEKWTLCDVLWPDTAPKKAEHSLHSAVSRMKTALKNAGVNETLSCRLGKYRMDMSGFTSDVWELKTFLDGNPMVGEENIDGYESILKLYRGDFLGSEDYVWAEGLRSELERDYLAALRKAAAYFMGCGRYGQAQEYLRLGLARDPGDEEAAGMMMEACFRVGDQPGAAACYRGLCGYLKREFGVAPKPSVSRLYQSFSGKPGKPRS